MSRLSRTDTLADNDAIVLDKGNDEDFSAMDVPAFVDAVRERVTLGAPARLAHLPGEGGEYTPTQDNAFVILVHSVAIAAFTLRLPDEPADASEIIVATRSAVTSLTVSAANDDVSGAPGTLAAGGYFRLRYDAPSFTWYRVG